jgi:adenine-specific DNA-methyltransferase
MKDVPAIISKASALPNETVLEVLIEPNPGAVAVVAGMKMFDKLLEKLKELFQLNQPELDFGIYRIMHAKADEITKFLEQDLLPQVKEALSAYRSGDRARLERELDEATEQAKSLGVNLGEVAKVNAIKAQLVDLPNGETAEAEVYEALYKFFRRYYSQGDFLSRRVYKKDVYAIPYEGEEVMLHWANRDQYYIKSSETLRDYAFRLRPEDKSNPMRVHFRVIGADEEEHNTTKVAEGKQRVFRLAENRPPVIEDGELHIFFRYEQADKKQIELTQKTADWFKSSASKYLADWKTELLRGAPTKANESRTLIEKHLERYTARNTFDYFIHKDLGGFLHRELDFFIKNEIMHLDDIEDAGAAKADQYLAKIKAIRIVAGKIIIFLAELEDFQKKLWLKKKFVVGVRYLVVSTSIPHQLWDRVVENQEQMEEWNALTSGLSEDGDLFDPKDSDSLGLYLDTKYFDEDFKQELLEHLDDVDGATMGVLVHGDNFQGLSLLTRRFSNNVDLIYIDPPYNTAASEILYKNDYRHSSWLALMADRLDVARTLMGEEAIMQVAIDDAEFSHLELLLKTCFGRDNYVSTIAVVHNPKGRDQKFFAIAHEYTLVVAKDKSKAKMYRLPLDDKALKLKYRNEGDEGQFRELPLKRTGSASARSDRPSMFFPFVVDPSSGELRLISGDEYEELQKTSHGDGSFVDALQKRYTQKGLKLLVPVKDDGKFGRWRWGLEACRAGIDSGVLFAKKLRNGDYAVYQKDEENSTVLPKTFWIGERYDASSKGTNVLKDVIGPNDFDYPKSIFAVEDFVRVGSGMDGTVLDFFAGSGTTAHAVINLNRLDGSLRRFVLIEGGSHFETVLMKRVKRVLFTGVWKQGVPKQRLTQTEFDRSPQVVKVVEIESYEDTLNNLDIKRPAGVEDLFAREDRSLREEYVLRYMLNVETRGSTSLLNASAFSDPRKYTLRVKSPGSDETVETAVDLLETFNWLLGLRVRHIAASETFSATFNDNGKRLSATLKTAKDGVHWFRPVAGMLPDGREALIVWRTLTDDAARDEAGLLAWFSKKGFLDSESLDVVYVNGDCNLAASKPSAAKWTIEPLEARFHELMFEGVEV